MAEDPITTNMPFVVDENEPKTDPATLADTMPLVADANAPKPDPSTLVTLAGDMDLPDTFSDPRGAPQAASSQVDLTDLPPPPEPAPGASQGASTVSSEPAPPPQEKPKATDVAKDRGQQAPSPQRLRSLGIPGFKEQDYSGFSPRMSDRLAAMLEAAPPEVRSAIKLNSGYRSQADQQRLYDDYVAGRGNPAAKPGTSRHESGEAADIGFQGNDSARQWFHANAKRFGLSFPLAHEPWHMEVDRNAGPLPADAGASAGMPSSVSSNPIAARAYQMASEAGLPADAVVAILKQESNFNPRLGMATSSAFGIGQLLKSERDKLGIGDSTDPEVQLKATMPKMRDAYDRAKAALGREPSAGEMYVVYYQGAGAGPAILKDPKASFYLTLERVGGEGYGRKVFDANPWLSKAGIRTNEDFIRWSEGKMTKAGTAGGDDYTGVRRPGIDTSVPYPLAGSQMDAATPDPRTVAPSPGYWQMTEAAWSQSTTAYVFSSNPMFTPQPGYQVPPEQLREVMKELPEKYHNRLVGVSPEHTEFLIEQARAQHRAEQTLAAGGWTGAAIDFLVGNFNPVDLGIGLATAGIGTYAANGFRLGRTAMRVAGAAGGALGNVGSVALSDEFGRATEGSEYAYAAVFGAGLGFAFGSVGHNPATADIAANAQHAVNRALAPEAMAPGMRSPSEVSPSTVTGASAPAHGNPPAFGGAGGLSAAPNPKPDFGTSSSPLAALTQGDVSRTGVESLRPDMTGQLGSSKNPIARLLGSVFGMDVVGRVGPNGEKVVNPMSVGERMKALASGWDNRVFAVYFPAFDAWAKNAGYKHFWERFPGLGEASRTFNAEVNRYRLDRGPDRELRYAPEVARAGDVLTRFYSERLKALKDAGHLEDVPDNAFYNPRDWLPGKIMNVDASGRKFMSWLEGAYLSKHPELGDKAATIANGMYQKIMDRAFGLNDFDLLSRNGTTAQHLEDVMHELGIVKDDIDDILARLQKSPQPDFKHFKLDIDEGFELNGLRMEHFVETDAMALFNRYNRTTSAWVALGEVRVADKDGNLLINGIRSVNEFEKMIVDAIKKGREEGQSQKEIDADVRRLREQFDRIRGVPKEGQGSTFDKIFEIARNYASMVYGSSFGLSALFDLGRLADIAGIRAMLQHMPGFRMMIDNAGQREYVRALSKDMDAIFALADEFKPFDTGHGIGDEFDRLPGDTDGFLDKMLVGSRVGADAVLRLSGMPAINRRIREAASAMMAQRFFDLMRRTYSGMHTTPPEKLPDWTHNAWHGSPFKFGEFKKSWINSGEGTQHEGWGLYFGAHKKVGEFYRDRYVAPAITMRDGSDFEFDYSGFTAPALVRDALRAALDKAKGGASSDLLSALIKKVEEFLDGAAKMSASKLDNVAEDGKRELPIFKKLKDDLEALNPDDIASIGNRSHLYEVRITAPKEHFLDLEMPLHAQDPYIQNAVRKLPKEVQEIFANSGWEKGPIDVDILDELRSWMSDAKGIDDIGEVNMEVSRMLHEAGISGTKYLSGYGSGKLDVHFGDISQKALDSNFYTPGKTKHKNSDPEIVAQKAAFKQANPDLHNYVLFDDADVRVYSRDGITLLKLAPGKEVPVFDLSRLKPSELDRMKWFGLDDEMLSRVLAQLHLNAESKRGFLGEKVMGFNPSKWDDPEAREAFANALRRAANRATMEHDRIGAGTLLDRSPVFKTLMQFRRFALNAWSMNIQHGWHMRDGEAFADALYSLMFTAMLYTARTGMESLTQKDPDKYLKERLHPRNLAAATFQLSAYSSILPMIADTGSSFLGAEPLFGFRNSGLPSSALMPPIASVADSFSRAPGAVLHPLIDGRPRSQEEWRGIFAALPFQNFVPFRMALGAMIRDERPKPPQKSSYSLGDAVFGEVD